jgi:hypothetical protein
MASYSRGGAAGWRQGDDGASVARGGVQGWYQFAVPPDTTAPALINPTGTTTGSTTASGTVDTDDTTGGTLYYWATTNATETAAAIKASGAAQAVAGTTTQTVSFSGLTASTVYYAHYAQEDAASPTPNLSNAANSTSFTTDAGGGGGITVHDWSRGGARGWRQGYNGAQGRGGARGWYMLPTAPAADVTAPVLSLPTGGETGATTAAGTVTTDEGNGTLYALINTSATATAAAIRAGGTTWPVTASGVRNVNFTGLTASTAYYIHYVQVDTAGNESNVQETTPAFTTFGPSDSTAPSSPTSLTPSAITKSSYTVTWTASTDNVAVTGYQYQIDGGTAVDVGNTTSVSVTGRAPGATEAFGVRAYDAAGNFSGWTSAQITLPIYGFALSTLSGCRFGSFAGSVVEVSPETAGNQWYVVALNATTRALVAESGLLTIDSGSRLPNWYDGEFDSSTDYALFFHRPSDDAWAGPAVKTATLRP